MELESNSGGGGGEEKTKKGKEIADAAREKRPQERWVARRFMRVPGIHACCWICEIILLRDAPFFRRLLASKPGWLAAIHDRHLTYTPGRINVTTAKRLSYTSFSSFSSTWFRLSFAFTGPFNTLFHTIFSGVSANYLFQRFLIVARVDEISSNFIK